MSTKTTQEQRSMAHYGDFGTATTAAVCSSRRQQRQQQQRRRQQEQEQQSLPPGLLFCSTSARRSRNGIASMAVILLIFNFLLPTVQSWVVLTSSPLQLQRTSGIASATATPTTKSDYHHHHLQKRHGHRPSRGVVALNMFMGSDGGVLGIGTPELATILLVGYFVLGPSELYKLVKEIGKFIQNIRTLGTDLTSTLENNMESQLQLQELRKAQQELNDAFSFRRSINTNSNYNFNTIAEKDEENVLSSTTTTIPLAKEAEDGTAPQKPKIRRRRVLKKRSTTTIDEANGIINPAQLDMPLPSLSTSTSTTNTAATETTGPNRNTGFKQSYDPFVTQVEQQKNVNDDEWSSYTPEELAKINADFDKYTLPPENNFSNNMDWSKNVNLSGEGGLDGDMEAEEDATAEAASSRFQQQLSGNWNEQILKQQHSASSLSSSNPATDLTVLDQMKELLALLEQEKQSKDARLELEFRKRAENEEKMYQQQRQLLQQTIVQLQSSSQSPNNTTSNNNSSSSSAVLSSSLSSAVVSSNNNNNVPTTESAS